MQDIEAASATQLGYWLRYLESPGYAARDFDNVEDIMALESAALDYIVLRFKGEGGWSPERANDVDQLHRKRTDDL